MEFEQSIINFKENIDLVSSPIWIWYEKNEKDAKCKICKTVVPRKDSSTGGMVNHLKRHHNFMSKYNAAKIFEELSTLKEERVKNRKRKVDAPEDERAKKQPKLTHSLNPKYNRTDPRQIAGTNSLVSMICIDGIPTNIVNRPGFKNFTKTMDPRYTLPAYTTVSRSVLPKMMNNVTSFHQQQIEKMLNNECSMAFSIDGLDCQDAEKSAVYSFWIYFYENDDLRSEVVAAKSLEAPVTGDVIKDFLTKCLKDINVIDENGQPKISIWGVTDEGANIVRALRLLKAEGKIAGYIPCFNHNNQNVIKDGVKATPGMEKTLENFRRNAAIFSRCKNERSAFRKICATNDVVAVIPPVPNNTRWFADLMMLEAFLKAEKGIKLHATQSEKMIPLTAADWKNARGYVDILKPFHTATKLEEGENYVTLSSVIPVISILHEKTSAYLKNRHNNGFGIMFARNMLASLEDRFGRYPDFLLMKPHCLATFTDPRFARMYF